MKNRLVQGVNRIHLVAGCKVNRVYAREDALGHREGLQHLKWVILCRKMPRHDSIRGSLALISPFFTPLVMEDDKGYNSAISIL